MLMPKIKALLDGMPRDLDAVDTHEILKRLAKSLTTDFEIAVAAVAQIGSVEGQKAIDERLVSLLSAALDEARMARENGKNLGATFIDTLEAEIDRMKAKNGLTDSGRLFLASCWVRAGLEAPASLAGQIDVPDGMQDEFELDLSDLPDIRPMIEKLIGEASVGQPNSLSFLQMGLSELMATVPTVARRSFVRHVVTHPKPILSELGCALLLDRREEVRRGALDGLADRLENRTLGADAVARLTVMRSWTEDEATRSGVDVLVRNAMRSGTASAATGAVPKIHRAMSSLVDGSGAQSISVAVQTGGTRSIAVVLIKEGFGVKDAYVIPCSSASEQRNLMARVTAEVETLEVPLSYLASALAMAIADGLQLGHPPAPGLADVVQVLGLSELRPHKMTVAEVAAQIDPSGQLNAMSAQARGRLVNASADWDARFPMISASWYEDSDAVTQAIEGTRSSAAMKRALWETLEDRRAHWTRVIIRMAHLLSASADAAALQFAAVAIALEQGREMKKVPIMETIFNLSVDCWMDETASGDRFSAASIEVTSGPSTSNRQMPDVPPEKSGELEDLLKPAKLTQWWVDGYIMGVCTAPKLVAPGSWVSVLLNIITQDIKSDSKLQRILDLLMLRYNETLTKLRTPFGVALLPDDDFLISIWADGYLTAWEGNIQYWPQNKLGRDDKTARELLEAAASFSSNPKTFRQVIPNWLRQRFAAAS